MAILTLLSIAVVAVRAQLLLEPTKQTFDDYGSRPVMLPKTLDLSAIEKASGTEVIRHMKNYLNDSFTWYRYPPSAFPELLDVVRLLMEEFATRVTPPLKPVAVVYAEVIKSDFTNTTEYKNGNINQIAYSFQVYFAVKGDRIYRVDFHRFDDSYRKDINSYVVRYLKLDEQPVRHILSLVNAQKYEEARKLMFSYKIWDYVPNKKT